MNEVIIQKIEKLHKQMQSLSLSSKEILTLDEATTYLQVSKSFLYKLTSKGEITHFKPSGKLIYFQRQDLNNWMLQNKNEDYDKVEAEVYEFLTRQDNGK